jgi:pilus assembly protein Flp/PilA
MQLLARSYLRGESGATAIEYALVAALVSVAIIAVLGTIGLNLAAIMQDIIDTIGAAGP